MKVIKILFIGALLSIAFACSDDDDNKPTSLESAKLSFQNQDNRISPPSGLRSSENEYAQMAVGYIEMANSIGVYTEFMNVPNGATKTSTPITAANGRVGSTQTEYLVYIWSDESYGSVAYQLSEQNDSYVFELFFKEVGASEWLKYFHAEEKKDGSIGHMVIYDVFTSDEGTEMIRYDWERSGGVLTFEMTSAESDFYFIMHINESTGAGDVKYYLDNELFYEMTWDAAGDGTWKYYSEGEVIDEGSWS